MEPNPGTNGKCQRQEKAGQNIMLPKQDGRQKLIGAERGENGGQCTGTRKRRVQQSNLQHQRSRDKSNNRHEFSVTGVQ